MVDFTNYDRITDTLMYLSDNITLNFTISLSRKSKNGERLFCHYESIYNSDKFGNQLRSVKRSMNNFYFVINVINNFNSGLLIRPQDAEMLIMLIESKVLPWYFGSNDQTAFQIVDDTLVLKDYEPVVYYQSENKYLMFEPAVDKYDENQKDTRGIRLTLASGDSALLDINSFMGFLHLLKSDMYAVATNMLAYIKAGTNNDIEAHSLSGLGAPPENRNPWSGFAPNKFLDNK